MWSRADPVTRARELAPAIAAATDEIERLRHIPEPLLDELHATRLFRMLYPRAGGDEVEPATYIEYRGGRGIGEGRRFDRLVRIAFATSTHSRSRSSRATPTTRQSAKHCSAIPRRGSFRPRLPVPS
jgi:hypothetical protein